MVKVDKEINSQHFQFLSSMIDLVGMHGTMFLFAFNSLVGALFIIIFLPETKGKSFDEIVDFLERWMKLDGVEGMNESHVSFNLIKEISAVKNLSKVCFLFYFVTC